MIRPLLTNNPALDACPRSEKVSLCFRLIICIPSAPVAVQGAGFADQPELPGPQAAATKAGTGSGTPAVGSPHGGPNSPPLSAKRPGEDRERPSQEERLPPRHGSRPGAGRCRRLLIEPFATCDDDGVNIAGGRGSVLRRWSSEVVNAAFSRFRFPPQMAFRCVPRPRALPRGRRGRRPSTGRCHRRHPSGTTCRWDLAGAPGSLRQGIVPDGTGRAQSLGDPARPSGPPVVGPGPVGPLGFGSSVRERQLRFIA